MQTLEVRSLLAGNVLASLSGGSLILRGDQQANAVDVVVEDGNVIVRGRENTTINGQTNSFTVATGSTAISDRLFAIMGGGDDVLFVEGVSVGRSVHAITQSGNDRVGLLNVTVGRDVRVNTGRGADDVQVEGGTIGRDLTLLTGSGNDTILLADLTVQDDVRMFTGRHDDAIEFDTVTVGDDTRLWTGHGNDNAVLVDSTVGDRFFAATGRGSDFVMFDGSTVGRRSTIFTGGQADQVLTENGGGLGRLKIHTGRGSDAVQIDAATTSSRSRIRRNESGVISDADRDARLNDPTTGVLTRTNAVANFFAGLSTSGPLTIAVDTSGNTSAVQSNDTLATSNENFELVVATQAGATVGLDSDGDGLFDDATATADASGNATLNVTLVSNDTNNGENLLNVQASRGSATPVTESVAVHYAPGTIVRFDTSLGSWDVELFDDDAPQTVAAFLHGLSLNDSTVIHRNIEDFIIQGGGFSVDGTTVTAAPDFAAPPNEFNIANPLNSNVRGTLSTAQNSNINSFSGGWFINTVDNVAGSPAGTSNLDAVPHTVFGRVIGSGLTVVDAINSTDSFDVRSLLTNAGALLNAPLVNYTAGDVPTIDNFIQVNSVTVVSEPAGRENTFRLPENSPAGTSVGSVVRSSAAQPAVFEFSDAASDPDLQLTADDHFEGDVAAPVVLVEYFSLSCPACATAQPIVEQLLADNSADMVVVRRHLPNDVSTGGVFEHSFEAALAAEAAGRQGQFNEMVAALLARQSDFDNNATAAEAQAVFEDVAVNTLGLDLAQFQSDMEDQALADRITRDTASAGSLSATATPTFFINQQASSLTTSVPVTLDIQSAVASLNSSFNINRQTGEITVRDASAVNFEATPQFTQDVRTVSDTTETIPVTIDLIDANGL